VKGAQSTTTSPGTTPTGWAVRLRGARVERKPGVGTILELCAEPFRERIASSGMILSKGQANFETLVGRVTNAYYLLRCKCPSSPGPWTAEGEYLLLDPSGGHAG